MSTKAPAQPRLPFVDTLRGLAVVFMVPLHTSHGWLKPGLRDGTGWDAIQFFGGLAAPLFLSLAGVSLGLRWAARAQKQALPSHIDDFGRALSMIVLGYLLRLQMWIIDGAGFTHPESYAGQLFLLSGYALAYLAFTRLREEPRRSLAYCVLAAALVFLGFLNVQSTAPARFLGLARVDVLQCIGGSLALLIAVGKLRGAAFAKPGAYVVIGICAAFFASWTRSWVPGPLPEPLAAYLGQWPAAQGRSVVGLFPLFPWVAYTFIGAALGLHWGRPAQSTEQSTTLVLAYTALGACLALSTNESLPHIYQLLKSVPWLTQPLRVGYRVGLMLTLSGAALALSGPRSPLRTALDVLGRASLLIYWVHLELAFGAASSPFNKALSYPSYLLGTLLLLGAMLLLARARVSPPAFVRSLAPRVALR